MNRLELPGMREGEPDERCGPLTCLTADCRHLKELTNIWSRLEGTDGAVDRTVTAQDVQFEAIIFD
jgi:hypothetical protein